MRVRGHESRIARSLPGHGCHDDPVPESEAAEIEGVNSEFFAERDMEAPDSEGAARNGSPVRIEANSCEKFVVAYQIEYLKFNF